MKYSEAGVDIVKADIFVDKIKNMVGETLNENVVDSIGGFAAIYKLDENRYLAASTDGVGTKLKLAQECGEHFGVGIDLVAMCVNDLLCAGARPLFFLDYMAFGKLDTKVSEKILAGIIDGCKQSKMALIGGETAEMPGMYQADEYDLAGFSVGELTPNQMFLPEDIQEGDVLLGLASSGFHSNGYSLLRKLFQDFDKQTKKELLTPTKIYVKIFEKIRTQIADAIRSAAHITGSGVENIPRMSEKLDYNIKFWPSTKQIAPVFEKLKHFQLDEEELHRTFNMGVGMVLLINQKRIKEVEALLKSEGETYWILGDVQTGSGGIKWMKS